jgi:monoamine oxidase
LAGLSTAVELLDQGYDVDIYEQRPFIGGKVASYKDRSGNHVEMGLHVFFGWVGGCCADWPQPAHAPLQLLLHALNTSTLLSMLHWQVC